MTDEPKNEMVEYIKRCEATKWGLPVAPRPEMIVAYEISRQTEWVSRLALAVEALCHELKRR